MKISLDSVSDTDLEAELARRKAAAALPTPLPDPDFTALINAVTSGVEQSARDRYMDEDFGQYVFEAALSAVYGPAYWEWRRKCDW